MTENQIAEQHQQELLNKLHEFGRSNGYSTVEQMTMSNITETFFSFVNKVSGQCQIVCPYCKNKYLTRFDRIWITSNLNKHFREHETLKSAENNELENEQPKITNAEGNNEAGDITNVEFDPGDEQLNESLSKTIQLQIESLESPEKSPPKKHSRLILQRVQVGETKSRGKGALREKNVASGKNTASENYICNRTRGRVNKSCKN